MGKRRFFQIFRSPFWICILAFLLTLFVLSVSKAVNDSRIHKKMLEEAAAASRESDGAKNEAVLFGVPGYVGSSRVYAEYPGEGRVRICGANDTDSIQWKRIAEFTLSPGKYTFTGLEHIPPETLELQLDYKGEDGYIWFFQRDGDITFELDRERDAEMYVRVFPGASVDAIARPAVYKDE